jgi:hypothetical protein
VEEILLLVGEGKVGKIGRGWSMWNVVPSGLPNGEVCDVEDDSGQRLGDGGEIQLLMPTARMVASNNFVDLVRVVVLLLLMLLEMARWLCGRVVGLGSSAG